MVRLAVFKQLFSYALVFWLINQNRAAQPNTRLSERVRFNRSYANKV